MPCSPQRHAARVCEGAAQLRKWDRTRHYQAIIDWMLRPASGYTFMGTSPHAWARDNRQMAGDPQTAYIGGGYTADATGATIQIAWPGARWDTAGMAALLPGPPMRPVTLAGQRAWHGGADSHHVFTAVWSYGPALVTVTGTSGQHQVDAVMTGIIKAMTSPQGKPKARPVSEGGGNLPKIMTSRPFIAGAGACSVLALNKVPADQRPRARTVLFGA